MNRKPVFPPSFFEDEVREGFFVSNIMKRFWAEQLEVLSVFAGICERHSITWYASDGTLLGAARHKGYIPWDDDLDVCIMRDDAARFLDAAGRELPDGYLVWTTENSDAFLNSLIRIVNGDAIRLTLPELEQHHGCPYVSGIDVFLLDGVFPDPQKEEERHRQVEVLREAAKLAKQKKTGTDRFRELLKMIEDTHGVSFADSDDLYRDLRVLKERVYAACPVRDAEKLVLFWEGEGNDYYYSKGWFSETVELPFEGMTLPVPKDYDCVLRAVYGDWKRVIKEGGGHGYPCYYRQQDQLEAEIKKRALAYTFSADDLAETRPSSRHAQMRELAQSIVSMHSQIRQLEENGAKDVADRLRTGMMHAENTLQTNSGGRDWTTGKKEVLFLPVRGDWWQAMEPFYKQCMSDNTMDVYVCPIPWYEKSLSGIVSAEHHDRDAIEACGVPVTTPDGYDPAVRCPDIIVTQFPFDGFSLYLTIPPFYYTKNLLAFTERLVYIPPYLPDTPTEKDEKAIIALQYLIEQPAVAFSDEIFVPTEGMRTLYIAWLCKIGGDRSRELLERKIRVLPGV